MPIQSPLCFESPNQEKMSDYVAKSIKRFPTISSSTSGPTKALRLKSPTHSKPNDTTQQRGNRLSINYKVQKIDRVSPVAKKHHLSQKKQTSPLLERNVPEIRIVDSAFPPATPHTITRTASHTHKENVSPLTPGNVLDLIDEMQFTPATETKLKLGQFNELDYLSSLPNSINRNTSTTDENYLSRQLRPRRLATEPSDDEISPIIPKNQPRIKQDNTENYENDAAHLNIVQTPLINNKTFDLKHMDKSDLALSDLQESFKAPCDRIVFNKTATVTPAVSRPLSMIEEDERANFPKILEKTYEIKVDEDLKRDVKLVRTPLRKYSESMMAKCFSAVKKQQCKKAAMAQ